MRAFGEKNLPNTVNSLITSFEQIIGLKTKGEATLPRFTLEKYEIYPSLTVRITRRADDNLRLYLLDSVGLDGHDESTRVYLQMSAL